MTRVRAQGLLRCAQTSVPLLSTPRTPQAQVCWPVPGSPPVLRALVRGRVTALALPPFVHTAMLPLGLRDSHAERT